MSRSAASVLALLLLAAAAIAGPGGVHTDRADARRLPLPEEEGVFHFLVFGDRTGGPAEGIRVLEKAVRDANLLGPDLVMTVGDLVQGYNEKEEWLDQMREYRGVMGELDMPWFPVAGNHDIYWRGRTPPAGEHEKSYETHFGPLWYWFGHKNAAFVVLYTDEGDPESGRKGYGRPEQVKFSARQLAWLEKTLVATKTYDHVFLFMHHPRWIRGVYRGNNWDRVHALLKAAGNVTAVIGGHIHRMRHDGLRDGIAYLTLATVGGGIPFDVPGTGYLHHMNLVTVRKDRVTMAAIPVGAVIDPAAMTPEHLADVDRCRILPVRGDGAALTLDATAAGGGRVGYTIRNPAERPIEVTLESPHAADAWRVLPGHAHLKIGPGEERTVSFLYRRDGDAFERFELPRLEISVDYLAEDRRIALPAIPLEVPVRMDFGEDVPAAERNGAVALDGRTACLGLAPAAVALPAETAFTVEAWVRPSNLRGDRAVIGKTESSEYLLQLQNGRPVFLVHAGGAYVAAQARGRVATGAWVHLAGVRDEKEIRLYVGGALAARAEIGGPRTTNAMPLYVGAEPDASGRPGRFFQGFIDEVRISSAARYEGESFEPAARFEPDAATRLLLHLDARRGPFTPDASGGEGAATGRGRVRFAPASRGG